MNRRTTIKNILAIGILSASSFSLFKWFDLTKQPDVNFLLSKKDLISELAEMIIPATDTPGAKDANVAEFIIKMMLNCVTRKNQNIFIHGLQDVEEYASKHYNTTFTNCSHKQKDEILFYFEDHSYWSIHLINKIENKFLGKPFFTQLKELTVSGYCTSQIGATKGLAYDFIPGSYEPCVQVKPYQKSWATS